MLTAFQDDAFQSDVLAFQIGDPAPQFAVQGEVLWGIAAPARRISTESDDDWMGGLL